MHIYHVVSGTPVATILRPARTPKGTEVRTVIKHVTKRLRQRWPRTRIVWRGDSHYGRVEHEFRCFKSRPLGDDQILVAGVIDSLTNLVEHPEVVADRIERVAAVIGDPSRVLAGTDCGFDTSAGWGRVADDVVWAKTDELARWSGDRLGTSAPDAGIELSLEQVPQRLVVVHGVEAAVRSALASLVGNALIHARGASRMVANPSRGGVSISDDGAPLPAGLQGQDPDPDPVRARGHRGQGQRPGLRC
jgi:hypothetical protein